jgi:hypothetical protein
VKGYDEASIRTDLQEYLGRKSGLISPELSQVVADINSFTSALSRDGLQRALSQSAAFGNVDAGRPFIEVAETIVRHQIRFIREPERDIVRKSLFEAYTHAAGPQYILEPFSKTLLVKSLSRSGSSRKFVTMFFSLYVFNLICMGFQDDLRARVPDEKSFQLYMSRVEAICCDAVTAAVKRQRTKVDETWATAVARSVEEELLHFDVKPSKSQIASSDPHWIGK